MAVVGNISFTIPGRLSGKGRPKFARRGSFVTAYTPEKTRSMEAVVRSMGSQAMLGRSPMSGPVQLNMLIFLVPPASWSKRKRAFAQYVTGKPDIDNVIKLVGDALNGICWIDDSQIASVTCTRLYVLDDQEQAVINILPLEDVAA